MVDAVDSHAHRWPVADHPFPVLPDTVTSDRITAAGRAAEEDRRDSCLPFGATRNVVEGRQDLDGPADSFRDQRLILFGISES